MRKVICIDALFKAPFHATVATAGYVQLIFVRIGADMATAVLSRNVSLFAVINALTEGLRSVFVPYYRTLLDLCVAHLVPDGVQPSKKKLRVSSAAGVASVAGMESPKVVATVHAEWQLQLKVSTCLSWPAGMHAPISIVGLIPMDTLKRAGSACPAPAISV
jgi:hypothetical protein